MNPWRRRLRRLLLHPGDAVLLARVVVLSRIVSLLLGRYGVERTLRLIRPSVAGEARSGSIDSRRARVLAAFADAKKSPWTKGACLERSLVLYRLLNLDNIPVDLTIGLRGVDGEVDGHAWLSIDGRPVLEADDTPQAFRPTLRFPSPLTEEGRSERVWRQAGSE